VTEPYLYLLYCSALNGGGQFPAGGADPPREYRANSRVAIGFVIEGMMNQEISDVKRSAGSPAGR
jgi:hypothetical protein